VENTEEATFVQKYTYTYNLIRIDMDVSEYQTRYKLMHCSTGRLGNNNAILCIRVWIMNDL